MNHERHELHKSVRGIAKRCFDGSRGLQSTDDSHLGLPHRRAMLEPLAIRVRASLRDAKRNAHLFRGINPTATFTASRSEATTPADFSFSCGLCLSWFPS